MDSKYIQVKKNDIDPEAFFNALVEFMEWCGGDDVELEEVQRHGDVWTGKFSKA